MPYFGTPTPRTEDAALLTAGGRYVADLDLPGALHVTYVTSPAAHARIVGIDVGDARALPGVVDVITADDLDIGPYPHLLRELPATMLRPLLATTSVRFVGEPVVAIVSESATVGQDAADLVVIDLEELPAVVGVEAGLDDDVLLFPDAGTNVALGESGGSDDVDLDACEVVVRATFRSPRLAPCPLETRAAASRWEPDGRLTHWSSCQGPYPVRALLCDVHGLPPERVRVVMPDVGGSFGAKGRAYPEEVLLPWIARRVGRPVRWVPTRSQDMLGLGHARPQVQHVELGGRRDGTFEALRVRIVGDAGGYPFASPLQLRTAATLSSGAYRIPAVAWETVSVVTNTTPTTAYRGAGRPEAAALIERAVDLFADAVGMDPVAVRRRNLLRPEDFPYETPTGYTYDSGDYERCLALVLENSGYEGLRAEQARRRTAGEPVELGIGLATFVDRTAWGGGPDWGAVELRPDATVLVRTASSPYGQGHRTAWAMLVADRMHVPIDRIEVVHGDTDVIPRGGVTGGSRSVQRAGSSVAVAADELVVRARALAADLLEAAVDDVVLDGGAGGRFHVAGTPARSIGWQEIADATHADPLRCEADVDAEGTFPFGAYVAVVEVDVETGDVELRRLVTVDDAGRILNPLLAAGQVHGGAAQGIAQALLEEFVYDAAGNPLTSTFADYAVISATELPSFEGAMVETPSPNNPLGAKGIAESGTIGAPVAVQNAVVDALRPRGITHLDMPCTPERVWRALTATA